ncbi:MAG: hypothetical protein HW419_1975 [Deltaproteobacteria bacterium]|nr:hypothetical protein [Deltaproteobacteria bacterium]
MDRFDRRKMKRTVFAERVMQLRRCHNELRRLRVTNIRNGQGPIAVIGFLAEKTAQSKIVIKWIFDIERLQPLFIQTDDLRRDGKSLCVNVGVHLSSVVGYARIQLFHLR